MSKVKNPPYTPERYEAVCRYIELVDKLVACEGLTESERAEYTSLKLGMTLLNWTYSIATNWLRDNARDPLARESDGWSTSREAVGWCDAGPGW